MIFSPGPMLTVSREGNGALTVRFNGATDEDVLFAIATIALAYERLRTASASQQVPLALDMLRRAEAVLQAQAHSDKMQGGAIRSE